MVSLTKTCDAGPLPGDLVESFVSCWLCMWTQCTWPLALDADVAVLKPMYRTKRCHLPKHHGAARGVAQAIGNFLVVDRARNCRQHAFQSHVPHMRPNLAIVPAALVYTAPLTDVDFLDLASPRPRNTMALGIDLARQPLWAAECSIIHFF